MMNRPSAKRRLLVEALESRRLLSSLPLAEPGITPTATFAEADAAPEYTQVFGQNGDLWNPADETLLDFSYAGYHQGLNDMPEWEVGVNVRDFGAVGDGVADDTQAFLDAMEACPDYHVVFIPNGTYKLMDWLGVEQMIGKWVKPNPKSHFAFRGEDRDQTQILLGTGLQDIHPWDQTTGAGDPTTQWSWYGGFLWFQHCEEVGVENLTIKGNGTQYDVHFSERGYNGIYFRDVENAWVRDVTFVNIESGIFTRDTRYATFQNLRYESTAEWPSTSDLDDNFGMSGHHAICLGETSSLCLADNIVFENQYHHELTLSNGTNHCVFSNVSGPNLHFDFHSQSDNLPNNLFTEIDAGDGSLIWRNNFYGATTGSVLWNIDGDNLSLPVRPSWVTHPVVVEELDTLLVGWPIDLPDIQEIGRPWFEDIAPENVEPQNIYHAQRRLRLGIETEVFLYGDAALADVIDVRPGTPGGAFHEIDINGTVTTYDAAVYDAIYVDGLGGADTVTIHGTDQDESVTLGAGKADVLGQSYEVHVSNVEEIDVDAGTGDDEVAMTGSAGSNRLYSYPNYARLADSPRTLSYRADGFDSVTVDAPGAGRDYAFFYDSPDNDEFDANPDRIILNRAIGTTDPTVTTATGFRRVCGYATQGGTDTAALTGSDTTRNRFYGYADYSILTESRRSFYFYTRGFSTVAADSPGSGYAYAYLHDSPGLDTLTGAPTSVTLNRAAGWSDTTATGFKRVYAYSTRGGEDTAELTGSSIGGNRYRGYPRYSTLTDTSRSFYYYARGFHSVTATGSVANTSSDRAYLYDSHVADTFVGSGNSAVLKDTAETTYRVEALYFDLVYARSSDRATNDTVDIDNSLVYNLIRSGTW